MATLFTSSQFVHIHRTHTQKVERVEGSNHIKISETTVQNKIDPVTNLPLADGAEDITESTIFITFTAEEWVEILAASTNPVDTDAPV